MSDRWTVRVDGYGCWLWSGKRDPDGYGRLGSELAHRVVYQDAVRQLAPGEELDHLCRRKACVRPSHLEPVGHRENKRRMPWRRRANQERCSRGHELYRVGRRTPEGGFVCRSCDE